MYSKIFWDSFLYVAQSCAFLTYPLQCWENRCAPHCSAFNFIFSRFFFHSALTLTYFSASGIWIYTFNYHNDSYIVWLMIACTKYPSEDISSTYLPMILSSQPHLKSPCHSIVSLTTFYTSNMSYWLCTLNLFDSVSLSHSSHMD
jgi:hypothetical protein